jgi:hypothetical protein
VNSFALHRCSYVTFTRHKGGERESRGRKTGEEESGREKEERGKQAGRKKGEIELRGHDGAREGGAEADREQDQPAGDIRQAPERAAEEGLRAVRALRRRGRPHHLLQPRPPLRVLHILMVRMAIYGLAHPAALA